MIGGVLKEIKVGESRVCLTSAGGMIRNGRTRREKE